MSGATDSATSLQSTVDQLLLKVNELVERKELKGKVQVSGTQKLSSSSSVAGFNADYYYDVVIVLTSGTTTDTKVYVQLVTEQPQQPATFLLNTSITYVQLRGVKLNKISTDSTLTSGQALYCYFIGYTISEKTEINAG